MPVDQLNVIDFISIDENDNVLLSISDHLEWDSKNEHIFILQEKINYYLRAIEGGALYEKYPKAKGRNLIIDLVIKYPMNQEAHTFIEKVKEVLEDAGYGFRYYFLEKR